jgi:hypothetical protein
MVSSRNTVAALLITVARHFIQLRQDSPHNRNKIWFGIADLRRFVCGDFLMKLFFTLRQTVLCLKMHTDFYG